MSAASFLSSLPASRVYTGMRTLGRTRIFQLHSHLERLAQAPVLQGGEAHSVARVRERVLPEVRAAVERFGGEGELKILVAVDASLDDVRVHVSRMAEQVREAQQVEAVEHSRGNASVKHAGWAHERELLEPKRAQSNEVILVDSEARVYEGLSSNFFALLADGSLCTAPQEAVLLGTTMRMLLEIFPVRFEFPRLSEATSWRGAFITSTSRMVLPVHRIILPGGEPLDLPVDQRVLDIQERAAQAFESHCEEY